MAVDLLTGVQGEFAWVGSGISENTGINHAWMQCGREDSRILRG